MRPQKVFSLFTLILVFSWISCTQNEGMLEFKDWDKDNSGEIDKQEFIDTFTLYYFDDWDRQDDDFLDDEDFYQAYYEAMDADDDKGVSEDEFSMAFEYFNRGEFAGSYQDWDIDDDFILTYEEYQAGLYESTFFSEWDFNGDGQLDDKELATGLFRVFDINDNGLVDKDEYETYKDSHFEI